MAVSYTTTYNLTKPEVGASEDQWGGLLNDNLDDLDNLLDGTTPVTGIDINSGTIDGTVIGGTTPAAGTFTNLEANGTIKLDGNYPVGTNNVALGDTALDAVDSGAIANTAVGHGAATALTSGDENTAVGNAALATATTAINNTAVGSLALQNTTTGGNNVAVGKDALNANTTASDNTAVGYQALDANTTGTNHVAIGRTALSNNTTGLRNVIIGNYAGGGITTHSNNTALGYGALNVNVGSGNTAIGHGAGSVMLTGSNNTILGSFNGNQGGLNITTSSNNIVLSDGDGNPRVHIDNVGRIDVNNGQSTSAMLSIRHSSNEGYGIEAEQSGPSNIPYSAYLQNANTKVFDFRWYGSTIGHISNANGTSISYNTTSDYRLKENVVELTGATDRLKQLNPSRFNFIADADTTVDGFLAHEVQAVVPEAVTGAKDAVDADGNPEYQGIDQSKLVPLLVATIQELEARITALEAN